MTSLTSPWVIPEAEQIKKLLEALMAPVRSDSSRSTDEIVRKTEHVPQHTPVLRIEVTPTLARSPATGQVQLGRQQVGAFLSSMNWSNRRQRLVSTVQPVDLGNSFDPRGADFPGELSPPIVKTQSIGTLQLRDWLQAANWGNATRLASPTMVVEAAEMSTPKPNKLSVASILDSFQWD